MQIVTTINAMALPRRIMYLLVSAVLAGLLVPVSFAQQAPVTDDSQIYADQHRESVLLEQLQDITDALAERSERKKSLVQAIAQESDSVVKEQLQTQLKELESSLLGLDREFEQLVVGDIESDDSEDAAAPFDWRAEMLTVLQPLIESLKSVTEKPRKLEELRKSIEQFNDREVAAKEALQSIEALTLKNSNSPIQGQLDILQDKWNDAFEATNRHRDIAQIKLDRILAERGGWWTSTTTQLKSFLAGRGLTILIMVLASIAAWMMMRLIWWLYDTKIVSRQQRRRSTRHRVLAYAYHVLTIFVVILIAILVLYVRSDLVLLALAFIVLAGLAISLRSLFASYVHEGRLLLDLGPVREGERVMYQGLPWQVMSLNVMTILRNPELEGVVRIPLQALHNLSSREFKDDLWFPSSAGDFVFLPDGTFAKIVTQTPEAVSVRVKGGMLTQFTAADFYGMAITNLSRGETFGVSETFGLGYKHQAISLTEIPATLHSEIMDVFEANELGKSVKSLLVELSAAGASSLDYLVWAQFSSDAAPDYYRIQRLIQQTCVDVCTKMNWDVPYPQMSVHVSELPGPA